MDRRALGRAHPDTESPGVPLGDASTSGAAVPLTAVFGERAFTDKTHKHRYGFSERRYASFAEAAQEAADSRLYAGLHYPMGNQNGLNQGERVGRTVTETLLGHMRGEPSMLDERLPELLFEPIHPDEQLRSRWRLASE